MKKETIRFKQASRRKAGKLKVKKQTIKDLKTLDEKAEKIKGGFKCNPSCDVSCVYISGCPDRVTK